MVSPRAYLFRDIDSHLDSVFGELCLIRTHRALEVRSAALNGHLLHALAVVATTATGTYDDPSVEG